MNEASLTANARAGGAEVTVSAIAAEATTVTSAALGNGFFHLPRFSAYYRAAFNEAPGQTLRRSRLRRK